MDNGLKEQNLQEHYQALYSLAFYIGSGTHLTDDYVVTIVTKNGPLIKGASPTKLLDLRVDPRKRGDENHERLCGKYRMRKDSSGRILSADRYNMKSRYMGALDMKTVAGVREILSPLALK